MTNLFTLCVHHGGHFQNKPEKSYVGGSKSYYDNVDPNRVSLPIIWKLLKKLGYVEYKDCYFLIPGKNLHEGLRRLSSNANCLEMVEATNGLEEIELFIKHTINQPDIVQEIGVIDNSPGCHDAERCNNAENVDIEVEVEEDFSTLVDGVDWEEIEVEVMEKSNTPTAAKGNVNAAKGKIKHPYEGLRRLRPMAGVESGLNAPMAGATSQDASVGVAIQHGTTAFHSKGSTKTNASNPSGRKTTKTSNVNWTPYVALPPQQNMPATPQLEASHQPKLPSTFQPEKSPWRGHQCTTAKSSQAAS